MNYISWNKIMRDQIIMKYFSPDQNNEIIFFLFSVVELLGQIAGCADGLMWAG